MYTCTVQVRVKSINHITQNLFMENIDKYKMTLTWYICWSLTIVRTYFSLRKKWHY